MSPQLVPRSLIGLALSSGLFSLVLFGQGVTRRREDPALAEEALGGLRCPALNLTPARRVRIFRSIPYSCPEK